VNKWLKLILIGFFLTTLPACIYSAAVSSAQAVYNRRDIQKSVNNNYICLEIYHAMNFHPGRYENTNITIAAYNNSVLLLGQAPTSKQKDEVAEIAHDIARERHIYNFIEVSNPTSTLIRASDSWITAKIKAQLIAINEVDPTQIKVITENGIVYLIGTVPQEEADIAVDVARDTDGVQKIIKIFSYIQISTHPAVL
jgi:osmotically-inducible protein OsmY